MKKLLVVALCAILSVGTFAGCKKDPPMGETLDIEQNAKITVWDDDKSAGYMPMLIRAFEEKYKDFNVKVTYNIKDAGDTVNDLVTSGPAGKGADVLALNHDKLGTAVKQSLLFPNDKYAQETKDTQAPDAIAASSVGETLYGYPIGAEGPVLFYNKKLFEGKEDSLKTFDALKTFSQARHTENAENYGFMFNNGWGNAFQLYGLFAGYGGYAFGKNGTDPQDLGLNNEGALQAAAFYRSWVALQAPGIDGDGTQVSSMVSLFATGRIAAFYAEPAAFNMILGALSATSPLGRDDVGVTKLPTLPGGKEMKPFITYKMYGVNSFSKAPKAARAFAAFSQYSENQVKRFINNGTVPTHITARANADVQSSTVTKASLEQVPFCTITPSIAAFDVSYWGAMSPALNEIFTTQKPVKEIMDACVEQMRTAIGNMG